MYPLELAMPRTVTPLPADLDATTLESQDDPSLRGEEVGVTVTVLWHEDLARIGASCWVPARVASTEGVSRLHPVFDDGRPLAHRSASRSPVLIQLHGDYVRFAGAKASLRFTVDGEERPGRWALQRSALARGVVVGLGTRGPLVLVRGTRVSRSGHPHGLVGASPALAHVRHEISRLAPRPFPVLVRGATGTGKELVSAALHTASGRTGRYIRINVAALPPSTAISQLFGHARGAFTGADRASRGYFGDARGGTLLLDEIGAAPLELQAQLLRVLESGEAQPVGGLPFKVDVRVIAATDEDLERAIAAGRFRAPLLHRLAHGRVTLPPLRMRPDDVVVQFVHFARTTARDLHGVELPPGWLRRGDAEVLLAHAWPGNSRELRAVAQRCAADWGAVDQARLPELDHPVPPARTPAPASIPTGLPNTPAELLAALEAHDFAVRTTADALGVSRNAIKRRMALWGMPRPDDLDVDTVSAAMSQHGTLAAAARSLRVSAHGLRLRLAALGLA